MIDGSAVSRLEISLFNVAILSLFRLAKSWYVGMSFVFAQKLTKARESKKAKGLDRLLLQIPRYLCFVCLS